jgi:hypothetical protein
MRCRVMFQLVAGEARALVPLKMLFVGHNFCYSLVAYLPIFVQEARFSPSEIGILLAIPCLCTIVGPPFWSGRSPPPQASARLLPRYVGAAGIHHPIRPLVCVAIFAAYWCRRWRFWTWLR